MRSILLFILLVVVQVRVQAQQPEIKKEKEEEWQEKFFQTEVILPLLMTAAINYSAEIEKLDHARNLANENLIIKRKSILSGVGLGSTYTYGTRVGLATTDQTGQNQLNAFVLPAQAQYNLGLALTLPLDQILSRGNELKKQVILIRQTEADRKIVERQIRQLVINLYQDIVLAKAQLKLHQEAFQTVHIHFKLAEKQFEAGEIPLSEMAKINESYSAAAIAEGTSKIKYATAFLLMEELIGMKIYDLMNGK